jgi:hypothetical protein
MRGDRLHIQLKQRLAHNGRDLIRVLDFYEFLVPLEVLFPVVHRVTRILSFLSYVRPFDMRLNS